MERKHLPNKRKTDKENLPANATAAIHQLIRISQKIVTLSERESQALVQRDMLAFSIIQDEKESVAQEYTKASEDFRSRLEQFRSVDKSLLTRLEQVQKAIGEKAQANNVIVLQMRQRAETNTQKTLLLAQEYGQQKKAGKTAQQHQGG